MAKHISQITSPLSAYTQSRFKTKSKHPLKLHSNQVVVPEVLLSASLRGEAFFRLAFFEVLEDKNIFDPTSQSKYWQKLMLEHKQIQELVEKIKLLDHFKLPTDINGEQYQACCLTAYCILIWDIHQNSSNQADNQKIRTLLHSATKGFVLHYLPSLYPKKTNKNDPQQLKSIITSILTRQTQERVEIKESFTTSNDQVVFSLIAKSKSQPPTTLISLTGERLKATRLKAYKQVEAELKQRA